MSNFGTLLLQRARTIGARFFHRFGIHCATHQIRVILISSVVITSLFYPALAIYSSQHKSLSILETFFAPDSVSGFHAQHDLVNIWSGHDALRIREKPSSRTRCGIERTLRIERILIQSPLVEDDRDGTLNHQILLSTLHLENSLEKLISSRDMPCLRKPDGHGHGKNCFVLSPLSFWSHDEQTLLSDYNILDTLSPSRNVSVAGIHVTPPMVLASRGSNEHHVAGRADFDFARFLALTYFFSETNCFNNLGHAAWLQALENAATQSAELSIQTRGPTLIQLEYNQKSSQDSGCDAISAFLYIAYVAFFAYVSWSMRRMDAVHSRIGLTFTALVEIAVSTVTSLSVCALVGFKVTMVPWELLPIVIVFVGAENMFNLVDAVGKTSVTLPVKERIALGLSRAGTSNTLKVVSYNAILGVISVFAGGAIRQFCVFAIVVLVAHWFLAHTFFMAVLSIDIQRLELDELLRQNSSLVPPVPSLLNGNHTVQPRSRLRKLVVVAQNLLRGRATKNISLFLLLAITATLYYTTYPASTRIDQASNIPPPRGALARSRNNLTANALDVEQQQPPAWHVWKALNPKEAPVLHLRIEMPSILTFMPDADTEQKIMSNKSPRRFSMRTLRLVVWLLKIVVLPITATTSVLWGLLLYLLKNAELLEAQRNRAEPDSLDLQEETETALEGSISFSTLPRAFPADVYLIAASKDGHVIVSVSLQNEVVIWRMDNGESHVNIDVTDVLLRAASTSSAPSTLTSVAVDDNGEFCAVGTGAGIIAVWAISRESVRALPHLSLDHSCASALEMQFLSATSGPSDGRTPPHSEPGSPSESAPAALWLVVSYEHGLVAKWAVGALPTVTYLTPSHRAKIVKSTLVRVRPEERLLVAFCMNDGMLELTEVQDSDPLITPEYCIKAGDPRNVVSKVNACRVDLGGSSRFIVGIATEAGSVSLWDGFAGECISIFEDAYGKINHLQISPIPCEACHYCGELPLESFSVAFSVGHVLHLFKAYLSVQTRRCSCPQNQPRRMSSWDGLGRRSRSSSAASSVTASPSIPRTKLSTSFEASPFPVSGHGVHSRRASEKDLGRRGSESLTVPFSKEEYESNHNAAPMDHSRTATGIPPFWQSLFIVRVADVAYERGGWNVSDRRIVGVRRKPRSQGQTKDGPAALARVTSSQGLTPATLERWELWIFDLSISRLQRSPLAALTKNPDVLHPPSTSICRSSRECIPRLPFTRISPFLVTRRFGLAGFGNTVGVFDLSTSWP